MECLLGPTGENMKVVMYKIKNKVMARLSGPTERNTWAIGSTAGSMAAECISCPQAKKERACGKMVRESSGQMRSEVLICIYSVMCG